ncbi:MAG: DUF5055 domain-containing protein [Lachnospiraceae bacterium]|nr:DUF5055 domain-containing protein [Lachnospiraceae bacterium]
MVRFNYEGKEYVLGFNRKTAEMAQRSGFDLDELYNKSFIQIPLLFRMSFAMNHPRIKNEKIEEIYEKLGDKTDLLKELILNYRATFETLFGGDEDDEGDENFIKWSSD